MAAPGAPSSPITIKENPIGHVVFYGILIDTENRDDDTELTSAQYLSLFQFFESSSRLFCALSLLSFWF